MSFFKENLKFIRHLLFNSQKKIGFVRWRYVFTGFESVTGLEKKFFVEFTMLNPSLSSSKIVSSISNVDKINLDDYQNALSLFKDEDFQKNNSDKIPSYVKISAGVIGPGTKQVSSFVPLDDVDFKSHAHSYEISSENFLFSDSKLNGKINVLMADLHEHPEYLCDSGSFAWDLRYEIQSGYSSGYSGKTENWFPMGIRSVFSGSVSLDGNNYTVIQKKSHGYIDFLCGKELSPTYMHISSSNLESIISGKNLHNSSFAIQGIYNGRFSIIAQFEETNIEFEANKRFCSFETHWNFSQMPENNDQEKFHWTVSAHNKKYIIDIDAFSYASQMTVRTEELPEGQKKAMQFFSGLGNGEIRIYKRIRKNLELIEHAKISSVLCEFGQKETVEI